MFQSVELEQVGVIAEQRADLLEVLQHRRHDRVRGSQCMAGRHVRGVLVKMRDLFGQGIDVRAAQFSTGLQFAQQLALRELTHF
ncbi:hypothetical protein D3C77_524610 [compost metagenome]